MTISTCWLNMSPYLYIKPIHVMFFNESKKNVLRSASRLDAFSGYP